MKPLILNLLSLLFLSISCTNTTIPVQVGLYRTFEKAIKNTNAYSNKFTDAELSCTFTSPSGKETGFYGFFDGDGAGGGNLETGNIWKIRFIPDEVGEWKYEWKWNDNTPGGKGKFICSMDDAGKGILKPYKENPRWFAYNGTDPVWLKSYYESGHGSIAQPFEWITSNVYQPILDRGYNHLQVNWLLSLCCFAQIYNDGPAPSSQDLTLYEEGKASSTMRLDVWQMMEEHVAWFNDRNVGLHMFLGFDGSQNDGPKWTSLSDSEKDFFVKYSVARLAPYANIAGWNFVWEVPGDRQDYELGWAQLVRKYDVFDHLITYEDEHPVKNEFERPEYNFAGVENHSIFSEDRDTDRPYWKEAWTHHEACLAGYVTGKPVYMVEGNSLWRRFWQKRTNATLDDLRQSAWACVTAGASFNWCGQAGEDALVLRGPEGLPFFGDENIYATSANEMDILSDVMNNDVAFFKMTPTDNLLSDHDPQKVWSMSEKGSQYLVFASNGNAFNLQLEEGTYTQNKWLDSKTGESENISEFEATSEPIAFTPPSKETDWVLIVKK